MKSKNLEDLFFFTSNSNHKRKRLNNPVSYDLFKEIIFEIIPSLNKNIEENFLIQKYEHYLNIFKLKKSQPNLSFLGFYSNTRLNKRYYISRGWSEEESISFIKKLQSNNSLEKFVKKYGERLGLEKFNEYTIKRCNTYSLNYNAGKHKKFWRPSQINYWLDKGISEDDAKAKMFNFYSNLGKESYIKRKENGEEILTVRQIKYWINKGLSLNDASEQLRQIQDTRSLDHYIELYGREEGIIKFKKTIDKWLNTLNSKTNEEKLSILIRKTTRSKRYSQKSIDLFEEVLKVIKNKYNIEFKRVYMGSNEYFIYNYDNKKINFYDLCIKDINLIIEYNGVAFHPNKDILSESEWKKWINPISRKTADEQYLNDEYKQQLALSRKFNYLVIWENETFEYAKNRIINKILELNECRTN